MTKSIQVYVPKLKIKQEDFISYNQLMKVLNKTKKFLIERTNFPSENIHIFYCHDELTGIDYYVRSLSLNDMLKEILLGFKIYEEFDKNFWSKCLNKNIIDEFEIVNYIISKNKLTIDYIYISETVINCKYPKSNMSYFFPTKEDTKYFYNILTKLKC